MNPDLVAETTETKRTKVNTMRAAVITAPGTVEIQEVPLPEPGPTQVRIKMEGCGLCASNIPVWQGREWFSYPIPAGNPGHEGWGVVDAVGTEVKTVKVGDRVAALSYNAYAEYDLAEADAVVQIPEVLAGVPFPGEPLGCAINIFKRSDIQAGHTVAILGIGFLGALLVQLAKEAGARVIALSQRDYSLNIANEAGTDKLVKLDDHYQIIEKVKNLTGGNFCERVIECTGKEWPLNLAGELTAERGKLIIAGFHQDGMRSVNVQLWNWRGLDVINAHERDPKIYLSGISEAVKAVITGRLTPQPLYTHEFPLENMAEAFQLLNSRPDGFMKALVKF
ncbi:oxidoreductase [Adhaeribacter aerolatus]|uniref:Oxidoreductase n=1 Tax=Adhaeribacter aerolatus TaxID=670289 RepID=A0A512B322_9BACT|nr:zinc-binding dehydrogenase [Adhaeribacter aerolatus]GEO06359.1 oxidoreductase [Adhaeribacter aerolatus]